MENVFHYIHLNSEDVPIKNDGESDEDFEKRLERFRQADRRVATDLHGKVNFGFARKYRIGNGVIGIRDWEPKVKMIDGVEDGTVNYDPHAGGSWSLKNS